MKKTLCIFIFSLGGGGKLIGCQKPHKRVLKGKIVIRWKTLKEESSKLKNYWKTAAYVEKKQKSQPRLISPFGNVKRQFFSSQETTKTEASWLITTAQSCKMQTFKSVKTIGNFSNFDIFWQCLKTLKRKLPFWGRK